MAAMVTSATMFEVVVPEYKQLKACRRELVMIKNVWDHVIIIHTTFDNWKSTPWRQINIELMDQECKKFSKELRVLDKETRAWDAYNGAENTVKNMMTSLRAVGELQNPSIRDRHWTQLMQATGVSESLFISTKTSAGNQKGLCSSMPVPIPITHNSETPFKHIETKKN